MPTPLLPHCCATRARASLTSVGALVAALSLSGCATAGVDGGLLASGPGAGAMGLSARGVTPASELTSEVMYRLLVAEFAGRRGDLGLSLRTYLEVARETGDPAVAERAVRIAVFARNEAAGLEAARLWTRAEPDHPEAVQVHALLLLRAGRVEDARGWLSRLVALVEASHPGEGYARVSDILAREKDQAGAIAVMEGVVAGREEDPQAQFAFGHLLARSGELERARVAFERVLGLDPAHEEAALFHARVLHRQGDVAGALAALGQAVEGGPEAGELRRHFARMLVDANRYEEAREQFERIDQASPGDGDVQYALGLLHLQTNRPAEAEGYFRALVEHPDRRQAAWYYLGQIAESRQDLEGALDAYLQVERGEHRLSAQIRAAVVMFDQGDTGAARAHLQDLRGESGQEATRLYRAEAELLGRAGEHDEAMAVYGQALEEFPRDPDLLYARAMVAVKLDRIDLLERDLHDILSREPEHADALNALGYTLADRTDRIDEAYELIKRAYELRPNDHYIIDSMGWVLYRQGRLHEALEYLERAMEIQPDNEIAAHLGEVLWVLGRREAAREVWEAALEETPDDPKILDTKRRFGL